MVNIRSIVIGFLFLIAAALAVFGAPEQLQRDTQTKALIQDALDMKGATITLGHVIISDSAGIRTISLGSTNGTKIGATGDKMGFLGATPIVRPSSTTDLRQALINLGLYTTGGATPLNLNGGAFTAAAISGTTGSFSSTMGITGNTTIGGTLGVTGAMTGSSLALSGNETVGGTLGVTGASTFTTIAGTNETLSGTLGVTGNAAFGGTMGITGALTGSSAAFSGNETVGGTFAATGNSTFGGTLGITGALSGSSFSFSGNGTVGGTFGVTGNSTFGGTLGITGPLSGSSFSFSGNGSVGGTFAATGNTTVGGTLTATGVISSAGQISNLDFVDVSKAPYNADMTGATNSATALNNAITDAAAIGRDVFIPEGTLSISSKITVTVPVKIRATRRADYDFTAPGGTTIKWIGADGGTMMEFLNVARVGAGVENILFDCNGLAAFGLIVNGVYGMRIENTSYAEFTTGAGLTFTATGSTHTCSANTAINTVIVSHETSGIGCLWLSGALDDTSNSAHNTFINTFIIHVGSRPGIKLGYTDNVTMVETYIFRGPSSNGAGVLVDPTEHLHFPSGNTFYHLSPGAGGWVQPVGTSSVAVTARIYGYQRDNGAPAPDIDGGYLFWEDEAGNLSINTITVGDVAGAIKGTTAIWARVYNNADISIPSGVETALTFNSEINDTNAIHSTSSQTSRLTCKSAGTYTISANASFEVNATGSRYFGIRYNGGNTISSSTIVATPSNYATMPLTTTVEMAVNDYVEFMVGHDVGSPILIKSFYAWSPQFMMVRNP